MSRVQISGMTCFVFFFFVFFLCFFLTLLLQCKFANSTLLSLLSFSNFITPYDAQASSAFSALISYVFIIISSQNFSVQFLPSSIAMYTLPNNKTKHLKVTKRIHVYHKMTYFLLYQTRRSSTDSMWLAIVERVHGYLVPEGCILIVSCIYKIIFRQET